MTSHLLLMSLRYWRGKCSNTVTLKYNVFGERVSFNKHSLSFLFSVVPCIFSRDRNSTWTFWSKHMESHFSVLLCISSHSLRWFVQGRLLKDWPEGRFMNSLHLLLLVLCFVFVSFVLIAINMSWGLINANLIWLRLRKKSLMWCVSFSWGFDYSLTVAHMATAPI